MSRPEMPPSPPRKPVLGHALKVVRETYAMHSWVEKQPGDVASLDTFGSEFVVVTSPDTIEEVLSEKHDHFPKSRGLGVAFGDGIVAATGDQWEKQRDLIVEFFAADRINGFAEDMVSLARERCQWEDGEVVFIANEMQNLTMEVLFETLFDRSIDPEGNDADIRRAVQDIDKWFRPTSTIFPGWVPTPGRYKHERAVERLDEEADRLLESTDGNGTDMLSVLGRLSRSDGSALSRTEIRDQLRSFMFAGSDTLAIAMTHTLYQLGTHDAVRERFHEELDAVLGGDPPTLDDLPELSVTENVIRESVRLYPPVFNVARVAGRDTTIDGYHVPEGTPIWVSVLSVHRSEEYWDDPLEWRPSRWADRDPDAAGYEYLPFGAGPRICIGRRFSFLEAQIVLSVIGQRYRLDPLSDLEIAPNITSQPADGVPARVEKR